jgi:hypothetical protein
LKNSGSRCYSRSLRPAVFERDIGSRILILTMSLKNSGSRCYSRPLRPAVFERDIGSRILVLTKFIEKFRIPLFFSGSKFPFNLSRHKTSGFSPKESFGQSFCKLSRTSFAKFGSIGIKIPPDLSGTKNLLLKITRLFAESQDLILRPFHSFSGYRVQ